MKVAILDPSCLTWRYTHCLSEALMGQGCDVHVLESEFLYLDRKVSGSYRRWNHFYNRTIHLYGKRPGGFLRRYVKGIEHVFNMFSLIRFLQSLRPDIIHYQQTPLPLVDWRFLNRLKHIAPLVSTVHNTTPFHGDGSRVQRLGFISFLSFFDHLIVHTEYGRQQLKKKLVHLDGRISVMQGGPYDHYERMAEEESPGDLKREHHQNILFLGNISHYKGVDVLIRAFALLSAERFENTRLIISGNPKIPMGPLRDLAQRLGVDHRIEWNLRFVPEEQVHGIIKRAAIWALPYRQVDRSAGLATVIQYGIPVIASRIGGFAEMLQDGVHGHLVEPENPSALAKGLESILSDPKKANQMGKAVRELGRKWPSWDEVARQTICIYEDLKKSSEGKTCL